MKPDGDGGWVIRRPPVMADWEVPHWKTLYGVENEARSQAAENAKRQQPKTRGR